MMLSPRTILKSAPYSAFSALVFFLLPHAYDEKGRTPPVWPDWTWLDAIVAGIVWIITAYLVSGVDRRRRAGGKIILTTDKTGNEYYVLAWSALKTTGVLWIFAILRWIVPGSIWGSRAVGMQWFSWDATEYQFLVGLWPLGFLIMGYKDLAGLPCNGGDTQGKEAAAGLHVVTSRYNDPDWVALRHQLLEARVGRKVEVPVHLKSHPVTQRIETFFLSGEPGLLDQAAAELTENAVDPWAILTQGKQ